MMRQWDPIGSSQCSESAGFVYFVCLFLPSGWRIRRCHGTQRHFIHHCHHQIFCSEGISRGDNRRTEEELLVDRLRTMAQIANPWVPKSKIRHHHHWSAMREWSKNKAIDQGHGLVAFDQGPLTSSLIIDQQIKVSQPQPHHLDQPGLLAR